MTRTSLPALLIMLLLTAFAGCATEPEPATTPTEETAPIVETAESAEAAEPAIEATEPEVETAPVIEIPTAYAETIPASAARIHLAPVVVDPATGAGFWMSTTEVPWEIFDGWVYGLEGASTAHDVDGLTRPTKPYIPPDRGWGHDGFPAMSLTFDSAKGFCDWLSRVVGKTYRLPTEEEWELACRAGSTTTYPFGDDPAALAGHAWFWDNADDRTHAVGGKPANALGLHDMLGNVAEWCVAADGTGVVRGGSFIDEADACTSASRQTQQPSWNASDPQIPKSIWWLPDATFVGLRVVRDFSDE